jgi:lipopolysaccharide transport system permease protein
MSAKFQSRPGMIAFHLGEWSRYRDIVWYRVLAGLKSEARQNFLGYLWFILEPTLTTAIAYLIYALLALGGGRDRIVMLLLGTLTWQWFESAVTLGAQGIKSKLHIMMHFPLPKYIFPLVGVFISTWKFLCIFAVLLVFCALTGYPPSSAFVYLPFVLGAQLVLIMGLAIPLAVGVAYFNDLLTVTNSLFRLMMILSGAVFEASKVPTAALGYFYANPMAGLIESYRDIVLYHTTPNLNALLYAFSWGIGLGTLGWFWCRQIDGTILKSVNFNG